MQSISRTRSGGYIYPYIICRGSSLEAELNTGPWSDVWEVACSVLVWKGRRKGWRIGKRLISCIKIRLKMKPALGNLSALSKHIIENKCFLMKFFGKQRFSQRASSICSSLVRTEGWGRMCKMDGVYCIYVQKPESEIDLISYLDRVIRQNFFFLNNCYQNSKTKFANMF